MRVNTDSGLSGIGEVRTGLWREPSKAGVRDHQDLAPLIVGERSIKYRKNLGVLFRRKTFWGIGGAGAFLCGMALLILLFGISKGKYLGIPVYQLMVGKPMKN
ncbi:hypothetical protein KCP77_10270 [Salmonella enterica subsp. enterica]|nr:hypothetical protein KCP77_10270 [Salmonella enterica subsp. enterica]